MDGAQLAAGRRYALQVDADEWAAFLADPEDADASGDSEIVPVGSSLVDGLPVWAVDELLEAAGAWGAMIGHVDGRLGGLEVRDR